MGRGFEKFMRKTGRLVGTGKWMLQSVAGTEKESLKAEAVLGRYMTAEIERDIPLDSDKDMQERTRRTGEKLIKCLTKKQRNYRFNVIQADPPNAFALPGGHIYITRSLIDLCEEDENEIAFILGHEIGHIVRQHVLDRFITKSTIDMIGRLGNAGGIAGSLLKNMLTNLVSSAYSQDQELEADRFGATIMRYAGYDESAAARFMERMKQIGSDKPSWKQYFSTHPDHQLRKKQLEKKSA